MRIETEIAWDHLEAGVNFRWEVEGDVWVVVEVVQNGIVARPWRPMEWPESNSRGPALYQLHPDRRVWRVVTP